MAEDSPWLSEIPHLAGVPCFDMRQWRNSPEPYHAALLELSALIGEAPPFAAIKPEKRIPVEQFFKVLSQEK